MIEKKVKPETEIRNLKKRVADLEKLCEMAGVPMLIIHIPQLAIKGTKISKEDKKWAKEKIKEYNAKNSVTRRYDEREENIGCVLRR